jgi:hypothetical protein
MALVAAMLDAGLASVAALTADVSDVQYADGVAVNKTGGPCGRLRFQFRGAWYTCPDDHVILTGGPADARFCTRALLDGRAAPEGV